VVVLTVLAFLGVGTVGPAASGAAAFIDAEKELRQAFSEDPEIVPSELVSRAIVRLAESLPPNGAIDLPWSRPCGTLDLRRVADGVQITGGWGGQVILGGGQRGIQSTVLAARSSHHHRGSEDTRRCYAGRSFRSR